MLDEWLPCPQSVPLALLSTKIEVTVVGVEGDNTRSTLVELANVAPVASPVIVVADVKVYVVGVEMPLTRTVIDEPAV